MTDQSTNDAAPERLAIFGTGTIATGLAALAAATGPVKLWARSARSAERAREKLGGLCAKVDGAEAESITVTTSLDDLGDCSFGIEAIVEDHAAKARLLRSLDEALAPGAVLATTTSSLSIADLAAASGYPDRFAALHVFNPVPRMKLVEISFPPEATAEVRDRTRNLCAALGKTVVEVPDIPGFVVNRLLFPYLFSAVELMEETGLEPEAVDTCMTLGAAHPLGPLALLDLVGLDVAVAIGEAIGSEVPVRIEELVDEGALGRKTGRGFYSYENRKAA